jgi:hypothetical protein
MCPAVLAEGVSLLAVYDDSRFSRSRVYGGDFGRGGRGFANF